MTGQEKIARGYRINFRRPSSPSDGYHITYDPRTLQYARGSGVAPAAVSPGFKAVAHVRPEGIEVLWENPPTDPEATREDFDQDVRRRVQILHDWLGVLNQLIGSVEGWVKELGWSTRWIDKPLEDPRIGEYRAPCLLMQETTDRLLLEPVARSVSDTETEGVVDLYLMPAYDDIASLFRREGRWTVHYLFPDMTGITDPLKAPGKPLSKGTLEEVLEAMRQHAT
jgi:hypothetical protein